jgi:hypothetical protein
VKIFQNEEENESQSLQINVMKNDEKFKLDMNEEKNKKFVSMMMNHSVI